MKSSYLGCVSQHIVRCWLQIANQCIEVSNGGARCLKLWSASSCTRSYAACECITLSAINIVAGNHRIINSGAYCGKHCCPAVPKKGTAYIVQQIFDGGETRRGPWTPVVHIGTVLEHKHHRNIIPGPTHILRKPQKCYVGQIDALHSSSPERDTHLEYPGIVQFMQSDQGNSQLGVRLNCKHC